MSKVGRKTLYNEELAAEICCRIAFGESVRGICRDPQMPDAKSIFKWLAKYPEFVQQYAIAKEQGIESILDECLDIADDGTNDWIENHDPENPGYKLNGEHVQRSRLRIETRKWFASKLKAKVYGEKREVSGTIEHVHQLTDEERDSRLTAILDAARERGTGLPAISSEVDTPPRSTKHGLQ